jgi:hypothetical protein
MARKAFIDFVVSNGLDVERHRERLTPSWYRAGNAWIFEIGFPTEACGDEGTVTFRVTVPDDSEVATVDYVTKLPP